MKRLGIMLILVLVVSTCLSSAVLAESSYISAQKIREVEGEGLFRAYLMTSENDISDDVYEEILMELVSSPDFNREIKENRLIEEYAQWYYMQKLLRTAERPVPTLPMLGEDEISFGPNSEQTDYIIQSMYSGNVAATYAYQYTVPGQQVESPLFIRMDADCTNFVSQCLWWGGIPMVDDPLRPKFSVLDWYYEFNGAGKADDDWSWTWSRASYLFQYLPQVADRVFFDHELRVGDIVSFDFDGDSSMDHSTIVTKVADGTVYLTYHSSDREDVPISELRIHGTAFGWRIR